MHQIVLLQISSHLSDFPQLHIAVSTLNLACIFRSTLAATNAFVHFPYFFRCSDTHKRCCTLRFVYFFQVLWQPQMLLYITLCVLFQVLFGNHKRYQDWFQRMYLSTPESQTLRCDLIRFICNCIHPTNKQIESKIMPRWAVIGWLLTTCTVSSPVSSHYALHDHR